MAKVGSITVNEIEIIEINENPTVNGLEAASGSMAIMTDGSGIFLKGSGDAFDWTNKVEEISQITKEPTGFLNRTDSALSFNATSRVFSISPTGSKFDYYIKGNKYTIAETKQITIPDIDGLNFIYFDTDGELHSTNVFDLNIIESKAYVSYIKWSSVDSNCVIFAEERHGLVMDSATHGYLHNTNGLQIFSGALIGFNDTGIGNSNSDAEISLTGMRVADEDITIDIVHSNSPSAPFQQTLEGIAKIPLLYRSGSQGYWRKIDATNYPVKLGSVRSQFNNYNGSEWVLSDATLDSSYLTTFIFATNNIFEPVVGVIGQQQHLTLQEAEKQSTWKNINFGTLPFQEFKLLYRLIYRTSALMTNDVKSAIASVDDYRFVTDKSISSQSQITSHAALSGLGEDDHIQYLLASGTRAMTGDLNMGGKNITNVNLVNGINIANKADKSIQVIAGAGLSGGGNLSSDITISMPNIGSAGTYGSSSQVPVITTDTQGRVSSAVNTSIQIAQSQVDNLIADLLSKQPLNSNLTAIASLATNGLITKTGSGTAVTRILAAGNGILISNGDGVSGNPTISASITNTPPPIQNLSAAASAGVSTELARADHTHAFNTTGVTPGSYGTSSAVSTVTVNSQGQVTSASNTTIAIPSTQVTDFVEAAQDAVAAAATGSTSISFSYSDVTNQLSASVVPSGVDHNLLANLTVGDPHTQYLKTDGSRAFTGNQSLGGNALTNVSTVNGVTVESHKSRHESGGADAINHDNLTGFVANEHIDHSAVSITAGYGLTGGGNITASRTLATALNYQVNSIANTTIQTTSLSMNSTGLVVTLDSGVWFVSYSSVLSATSNGRLVKTKLYINGTAIPETESQYRVGTGAGLSGGLLATSADQGPTMASTVITVTGTQSLELRWMTSGGTAVMQQRQITAIRIA